MSDVSSDQKNLAMLAHLLGIVGGFIPGLVIWMMNKDKPEGAFAANEGKEALNFQITLLIGWVAAIALSFILIGFLLYPVLLLGNIIFCIIAAMKAKEGVAYRYPVALRLVA